MGKLHKARLVCVSLVQHYTLILGLEPLDGILLRHPLVHTHPPLTLAAPRHAEAWPVQLNVEIHAENACGRVILYPQINVLCDAKPKVACTTTDGSMFGGCFNSVAPIFTLHSAQA
jgi:hypothetical protein